MVTLNAILIAVTCIVLGVLGVLGIIAYSGFRFLRTIAILKAAPDAKAAAAMLRADGEPEKQPEKQPMEMPATGIDELANSPEAIANLRKRQDPTPDPY